MGKWIQYCDYCDKPIQAWSQPEVVKLREEHQRECEVRRSQATG